ncbi:MAG: hypothetical protein IKR23_07960 [Lachnospiraceae bacterium]|nr:hypothetical protein [Lachnospiraceae bacterium]
MKSFLKIICVAMTVGMFILGGCTQDVNDEDVFTEETESTVPAPHKKADGSKYRLAYVDYDEYLPASKQLGYILEGLEEYGWIKEGSLPFTAEEIDKKELSTKQIYERCLSADLGEYIEFVDGGFFYIGYDDENEIAESLKERAGKDIDLVITFGTSPGVFVKSLDLPVPMIDFSATDPVASGIIDSATEGTGNPNVWAQVEASVPLRQLKYYHSLKPFNRLGMIVYGDEIVSGVPDVMKAAEEIGFSVVKYNVDIRSRETQEELDEYYAMVKSEFERMADEDIDAFFFTADLVNDPEYLAEMFEPLYEKNIPVYALDDVNTVYKGALMIISAYDFENVGRFVADAITRILDGENADSLPCVYTSAPYICLNLDVARRIDYPLSFDFLAACDEIYTEDKTNE